MNPILSLGILTLGLSFYGFQTALFLMAKYGNDRGYLLASVACLAISAVSFGLAF